MAGKRDPRVLVPGSLEEAKKLLSRFPPAPPGRRIFHTMPTKLRQCHGCHGFSDDHGTFPFGADRCNLEHSDRCAGGIIGGKDSKGKEWKPCPLDYLGQLMEQQAFEDVELDDSSTYDDGDSGKEDEEPGNMNFDDINHLGGLALTSESIPTSSIISTTSSICPPRTCSAGSSMAGSINSSTFTSVTSSRQQPVLSTGTSEDSELRAEVAALDALRLERETLEQAKLIEQKQLLSAKRIEIQRQVKAERDRIKLLKGRVSRSSASVEPTFLQDLRQQSQAESLPHEFESFYSGPNIKAIRKTDGLRKTVDNVVETIRSDVASLSHRPTAGHNKSSKGTGTRPKATFKDPVMAEFEQFKAWKKKQVVEVDSESDASPPRATKQHYRKQKKQAVCRDPYTDPSSSEDESQQQLVLVYRRDKHGVKYRSYEPVQDVQAGFSASKTESIKYSWVRDEQTGREYKRAVPASTPVVHSHVRVSSDNHQGGSRFTDHRRDSGTPETGFKLGT